tara:strand:- start:11860 stop:12015 length:156 start_codon:yes stop_codon:yes gene_type:complete
LIVINELQRRQFGHGEQVEMGVGDSSLSAGIDDDDQGSPRDSDDSAAGRLF